VGKVEEENRNVLTREGEGRENRHLSVKQKTLNERKTGKIADLSFPSRLKGNKL